MIGIFEALDWLNAIDGNSCLTAEERALSMAARVITYSEEDVRRILINLRTAGQRSGDPLEIAEVALHLMAIEFWRGWFPQAVQDIGEAVRAYRNDDHRRAVAQWMLGMAQWRVSENDRAYTNWRGARTIFQERRSQFRNLPDIDEWYESWTWQMDLELTAKPEEIYTWLNRNRFEGTSFSASSKQLADRMAENIRQRRYPDAYSIMREIQQINRWSIVVYERTEALFECGLAAYQMGQLDSAMELLRNAVKDFAPGVGNNHKQVVARYMLGAVEWLDPGTRNQAAVDWRRCIEDFGQLMVQADRDNEQLRRQWYSDRMALLEAALAERLPGGGPQGQKPRGRIPSPPGTPPSPTEDGPGPDTPPKGQETDPYQELLSKVRGDALTAERLIEYERRRAPSASREELIRRAIERWERDNR